jgi:hypothetical protein
MSVAPDVPKSYFEQILLPSINPIVDHATIYVARNDSALEFSKELFEEDPMGLLSPAVYIGTEFRNKWDTVDVSAISCGSWLEEITGACHSYHLESPYMQSELRDVTQGMPPEDRINLVREADGSSLYSLQPK